MATKKAKKGKPNGYEEFVKNDGLIKVEGWARDGLLDKQIAGNIGIAERTFSTWKQKHDALRTTLKRGKVVVDIQVENALLKKALGYTTVEITEYPDEDGKMVVSKTVTKEVPPDATAQIYWLKNRKPDEWREKKHIEMSGELNVTNLTDEQLDEKLKRIQGVTDGKKQ
jgi:hypothetical protein